MSKKSDARSFALKKRRRRQYLTFLRMVRYGVNNFSRNAWLTIAAMAVMTITLLIIFMTLAARSTLQTTVSDIRDNVNMSIYVKTATPKSSISTISADLSKLPSVTKVVYITPDQARQQVAQNNSDNSATLNALNEATNKLPGTFSVKVKDINNTSELDNFVKTNSDVKPYLDPNYPPSFAGTKRTAIKNIGRWVDFADRAGLIATIVFIAISSLIVFNTIRMAIFNRREEIQMMKLIGADRSFIRGPFIVEAVVYGFISALFATGLGTLGLFLSEAKLTSYQVAVRPTIDFILTYIGFVMLAMIILGSIIGVVSSLLATRRYLKI